MNCRYLAETISRRDADAEPPWMADICSCNICISYIPVGRFTACLSKVPVVHVGYKQRFQDLLRDIICETAVISNNGLSD